MNAVRVGLPRIARPVLAQRLGEMLGAGSVLLVASAGYGKSMALEEAIERANRRAAWVSCRHSRGEAPRLLLDTVEAMRTAVPGLADVLGDRFAAGVEPVDVPAATGALLAEVEKLLVEPLVTVFDDAEVLAGAPTTLALMSRLLNLPDVPLSVAIATRRPLPFRIAKLRAAGRIAEVGPADLAFTGAECEELLRLRHGRAVTLEEVEATLEATQGWPMGVALTSLNGSRGAVGAVPRDELFNFLVEEVLSGLDRRLLLALVDSSVPDALTPELAQDLWLPPDFIERADGLGLFVRADPSGARSYHPLLRSFLLERLAEVRSESERAALHARVAVSLEVGGRHLDAIDYWLEAGRFDEALALLAAQGRDMIRSSPATVAAWLDHFPRDLRRHPDYLFLEAQLQWGTGQHELALEPLRAAVSGYRRAGRTAREWLARSYLSDALISVGAFEEIAELVKGWEDVRGPKARPSAGAVAWYHVLALISRGLPEKAEPLAEWLRGEPGTAQFQDLDGVARVGLEPAAGRGRATLAWLDTTIADLEGGDPHARLPYALAMAVLVLRDLGEHDAALEYLDRCEREAERVGLGFVARDCQLQRTCLLAQEGDLSRAKVELARAGERRGSGWRGVHRAEAEAHVAALRGDAREAVAAAQRALERVAPGPLCYRIWTAVEMAPLLAENGAPDMARGAIDDALAELDRTFPWRRGRMHRARLLASRAFLEYGRGELEAAAESVRRSFEEADDGVDQIVRAHWRSLRPVLWHALEAEAVSADAVLPAMRAAFPGGEALVAMVDHPSPSVRRAALLVALGAGHPAVLDRLVALAKDSDAQVAAAAVAARERLRTRPPPLRFELLGGFRVKRSGWELDEATWKRPMAARVVRFLLVQGASTAVPEDELFEAFWPERDTEAARQHLAVAVSRARKVLDLPGASASVIEARERTYRLRLGERDSLDSAEFEAAAAGALADRGERRAALERAAALWTGEPLPEDRYAAWSSAWRERLVETYSEVLSALVQSYEQSGDYHQGIRTARALLEVNPLDERAHRRLMVAYARTGRASYALRQYLECRRALVVELGVEPAAETSRLQASILAGEAV